ncbi:TetR/AcrR family transcriptional regulator [Bosea thiooxidans]
MGAADTRQQIVEAADRLFYEQGFEATAFADIAAAISISRGNFYYHFKTKDEILDAVIALRLDRTRSLLLAWQDGAETPLERIRCFVRLLTANSARIMLHGCPVGTLCSELAKLDHIALARATEVFTLFREWLAGQFAALGRTADADDLAMHLLMRSQGVATLASAFRDQGFIQREVEDMCAWLDAQNSAAPSPANA